MNSWWQLLHGTVLNTEGLTFDGAEHRSSLTKNTQFGLSILDEPLAFHSDGSRHVAVLILLAVGPTQVTSLQLVG